MRIAIVIDALQRGGAERQAILSVAELQRLGHTAEMIVYHPDREYGDLIERENVNLVEIKRKGFLRSGRILGLARHFRRGGFDVVHAFGGTAGFYAAIAAKLARVPAVFGGYRVEYKERGLIRLMNRFCDRLVDGWIVNSRAIADSMIESLGVKPEKFHIVYNGIRPQQFRSTLSKSEAKRKFDIPDDRLVVSKVARLHPQKNHRMFLDMAAHVLENRPATHFMVVGEGALKQDLIAYAQSLGVSSAVTFTGNRPDIEDVLAATDISVLTSDFEGFPNVLIEAMSVGICVVSTDYPGIDELITDGREGFVVPRNNAGAMASKICQLLDDAELRKRTGATGLKMVEGRLSPPRMAKNLMSVYDQHTGKQHPCRQHLE